LQDKIKEWRFKHDASCPCFAYGHASHVHLVFRAKENNPGDVLGSFKTYTSKKLQKDIK
jgi:hypothetical protein